MPEEMRPPFNSPTMICPYCRLVVVGRDGPCVYCATEVVPIESCPTRGQVPDDAE
jgi:hypothetical protein